MLTANRRRFMAIPTFSIIFLVFLIFLYLLNSQFCKDYPYKGLSFAFSWMGRVQCAVNLCRLSDGKGVEWAVLIMDLSGWYSRRHFYLYGREWKLRQRLVGRIGNAADSAVKAIPTFPFIHETPLLLAGPAPLFPASILFTSLSLKSFMNYRLSMSSPMGVAFCLIKNVRLTHTRAGARLRQQPYSFARSVLPCRAFLFNRKRSFLLNKKPHPKRDEVINSVVPPWFPQIFRGHSHLCNVQYTALPTVISKARLTCEIRLPSELKKTFSRWSSLSDRKWVSTLHGHSFLQNYFFILSYDFFLSTLKPMPWSGAHWVCYSSHLTTTRMRTREFDS